MTQAPDLNDRLARNFSRMMFMLCLLCTVFILVLLVLVTGYLFSIGASHVTWTLFTQSPSADPHNPGGLANGLVGTIILVGLASCIGIPIGMLCGVYLSEYDHGSRLAYPVRFICDVLAGVPSIVVGILGYELVVVPMGNQSAWAGALALAFIMVPIVARSTEEMLRLIPDSYRQASLALGATKAKTILSVVLPAATGSVVTGIMLAIARVAGETAPLLFTCLTSQYMPVELKKHFPYVKDIAVNQPFPSLTYQIFAYSTQPEPKMRDLAWGGILVLIVMIFVVNLSIRFFTRPRERRR